VIAGTEMQWDRGNGFDFPQDCTDIFGRHELFDIPLVLLNISPTVVSNWVFFIQSGGKIRTSNLVYIYIYIYIGIIDILRHVYHMCLIAVAFNKKS
jgi:hypothetical protein